MSERRNVHSRDPSLDRHFPLMRGNSYNNNNNVVGGGGAGSSTNSRQHSRDSSWDKKYDDHFHQHVHSSISTNVNPRRSTPPIINILPSSTSTSRRNSNEFSLPTHSHSQQQQQQQSGGSWGIADSINLGSQASKRLLNKSLTKLSISTHWEEQSESSGGTSGSSRYHSSSNEKTLHGGMPFYQHHVQSFKAAPVSYIRYHTKRSIDTMLKPRRLLAIILGVLMGVYFFWHPLLHFYRSNRYLGGGSKFVIILAANQGGGVLEWKGPKNWLVEKESIKNKKAYAARHGYTLEIQDMKSLRRYAHEWRESWEKVDVLRQAMRKHPHAEWFWFMDIQTYIMEPEVSLQQHIFYKLDKAVYRDINKYNPINITHPLKEKWLDAAARGKNGDGKASSVSLIVPQDCGGFNLGSFLARKGEFMDRLMDVWWDPVAYEQMHMSWDHKEQDVLEHIYTHQPWARNGIAFIDQRKINSFPPGACNERAGDKRIFYAAEDRDFVVNMAGCEWGRDCAAEITHYKEVSEKLNKKKGWLW